MGRAEIDSGDFEVLARVRGTRVLERRVTQGRGGFDKGFQ
jgi:hypothetical protein